MKNARGVLCLTLVICVSFQFLPNPAVLAETAGASASGIEAEPAGPTLSSSECFSHLDEQAQYLFTAGRPGVILGMSDAVGRPATKDIMPSQSAEPAGEGASSPAAEGPVDNILANDDPFLPLSVSSEEQSPLSLPPVRPSLNPNLPDLATPKPSNPLRILSPEKKEKLDAGQQYVIAWKLDSKRKATYDILLSTDNGKTYAYVVRGITKKKYRWDVPDSSFSKCRVKVEAYVGDVLFAEAVSGTFSIKESAKPEPTPTPTPLPFETVNPQAVYRKAGDFFIDKTLCGQRWFCYRLQGNGAEKVVWQVSKYPFGIAGEEDLAPVGLIASGELRPDQTEFVIDFDAIVGKLAGQGEEDPGTGAAFETAEGQVLLPQTQYTFYVRAIALDAAGRLLGDAGEGLSTGYGDPVIRMEAFLSSNAVLVETWAEEKSIKKEGQSSTLRHKTDGIYAHPEDPWWRFQFQNMPAYSVAQELQVAAAPFEDGTDWYSQPEDLVFRERIDYKKSYDHPTPVPYVLAFDKFVPPAETLGTSTVVYYMRMVFFVQDQSDPSRQYAVPSETQIIYYNDLALSDAATDLVFAPTAHVTVSSGVPYTQVIAYLPVQWEDPNADEYYEVTRRIMAQENIIQFSPPNDTVIYPYAIRGFMGDHSSVEDYQRRLDTYLPVGTELHFTKSEPGLLDQLTELLEYAYNGVKDGYDDLKEAVVDVVADNFPFLDDDTREALRKAIGAALNIGLAALGLPPSMPNFEELFAQGFDYCLKIAIAEVCAEMGISEEAIPDEVRAMVTDEVARRLSEMQSGGNGNLPGYLRFSTKRCYRPAYVEILLLNRSDTPSVSGTLTVRYSVKNHFFNFYDPARLPIPSLDPNELFVIRCYLTPNIDLPVVDYMPGFEYYYYGKAASPCELSVAATYDVADATALAKEQGLYKESTGFPLVQYVYEYDHDPVYGFTFEGYPCWGNTGDMSVSAKEFYK